MNKIPSTMAVQVVPNATMDLSSQSLKETEARSSSDTDKALDVLLLFNCVAVFSLLPFGVVANILNILVFSKGNIFSRSTTTAVLSLAVVDLVYIATMPARNADCIVSLFDEDLSQWLRVNIRKYGLRILIRNCAYISISHIVVISLERVIAVYFPLSVNQIVTQKRMVVVLICIYVFWFLIRAPYLEMFPYRITFDAQNRTKYLSYISSFYKNYRFIFRPLQVYILNSLRGPLSMGIVVLASLAVGIKLVQVSKQRSALVSHKVNFDFKVARTLLIICVLYIVVGIPNCLQAFTNNFSSTGSNIFTAIFNVVVSLNDLLLVVNSSANFLVYFTTSTSFANKLKEILGINNRKESKITRERKKEVEFL